MKRSDSRIPEIEKRIETLLTIIEKQNENQAQYEARLRALENPAQARSNRPADDYKPVFDRWPGNQR